MGNGGRRLRRETGQRRYRRLFVLAVEGRKTEPQYFQMLGSVVATVLVKII